MLIAVLAALLLTPFPVVEGAWRFCRLKHEGDWQVDYPRAERSLIKMLEDVTLIDAALEPLVVSATGEDLSQCVFVFVSNVDQLLWTKDEAKAMGDWLHKGGLLWTDGMWKNWAWDNWSRQLRKALPEAQVWELHTHPIFEFPFPVRLRQPCPRGGWVKNFAVEDGEGRLMVLMTFNEKDKVARGAGAGEQCGAVGDAWEGFAQNWQDEEAAWRFSVNVLLYAMTH